MFTIKQDACARTFVFGVLIRGKGGQRGNRLRHNKLRDQTQIV